MPRDYHAGTKHAVRQPPSRGARAGRAACGATSKPRARERAGAARIYRRAWPRRAELRRHDPASGDEHATAIAALPGVAGETWDAAGNIVPRRYGGRQ